MKTIKSKVFAKLITDLSNRKFVRTKVQASGLMIEFCNEHFGMSVTEVFEILDEHAQVRASWKFARDDEEIPRFLILDFARNLLVELEKMWKEEYLLELQTALSLIDNFKDDESI